MAHIAQDTFYLYETTLFSFSSPSFCRNCWLNWLFDVALHFLRISKNLLALPKYTYIPFEHYWRTLQSKQIYTS